MYCRACYYDLRGQETPRCPECGRAFDPGNPSSFLDRPGRFYRLWVGLKRYRIPAITILTSAWLLCMVLGPPRIHARVHHAYNVGSHRSRLNLTMVMVQWMNWQQDDPDKRNFDRQAATRDLLARWSPWTEQSKFQRRVRVGRAIEGIGDFAVLTAVYALLVIPLARRRRRWLVIGGLAVCITLFYASFNAGEIAYALWPNSHAYLDDYVYINDIDLAPWNGEPSTTIAAYDWRSFEGDQRRIIAFADGHVEELGDDCARPLFEANGLEYPAQADTDDGD